MILILPLYYYIFMKIIFDTFYYLKEFKNNLLYLILFLILSFSYHIYLYQIFSAHKVLYNEKA